MIFKLREKCVEVSQAKSGNTVADTVLPSFSRFFWKQFRSCFFVDDFESASSMSFFGKVMAKPNHGFCPTGDCVGLLNYMVLVILSMKSWVCSSVAQL